METARLTEHQQRTGSGCKQLWLALQQKSPAIYLRRRWQARKSLKKPKVFDLARSRHLARSNETVTQTEPHVHRLGPAA